MPTAQPRIVLVHGALNDSTVWAAQRSALAARGRDVLALDLPGHGATPGPALASVEAMADWVLAQLAAEGIVRALLVGHSMGSLVALEVAHRAPDRVTGLALLGTAWPMKVSDALLATARDDQDRAIAMVAQWSHAPSPSDPARADALETASRALMTRVGDAGPAALLHTDLAACKAYANGDKAAASPACPVLFILGRSDRMTPPRAAATLTGAVRHGKIVEVDAGHAMMAEQPEAVTAALADFADACTR